MRGASKDISIHLRYTAIRRRLKVRPADLSPSVGCDAIVNVMMWLEAVCLWRGRVHMFTHSAGVWLAHTRSSCSLHSDDGATPRNSDSIRRMVTLTCNP